MQLGAVVQERDSLCKERDASRSETQSKVSTALGSGLPCYMCRQGACLNWALRLLSDLGTDAFEHCCLILCKCSAVFAFIIPVCNFVSFSNPPALRLIRNAPPQALQLAALKEHMGFGC